MKIFKFSFAFLLVLFFTSSVFSQGYNDETISYGGILAPGYISLNASFTYGNVKGNYLINTLVLEGKSNDYMLPELDVEVGVVDRLSLEVVTGYRKIVSNASLNAPKLNRSIKVNRTSDGLNSIMLAANVGLLEEHKSRPAMYLQNQFYIPKSGYSNFQNDQLGYFATLNMENSLSEVTYFDYSLGAGWDGNDPYAIYNFNLNPNFMITDNIVAYADLGGNYSKYSSPVNMIDIGTTIYFTNVFSLDAFVGNQLQTKNFAKSSFGALKFTFDFNAFAK
jgi:hypothetical protein